MTVPSTPIIIGITVTFKFNGIFNFLARSRYSSFFSLSFNFTLWSAGIVKSTILKFLFYYFIFFCRLLYSLVVWMWLGDPFVRQNPIEVCMSHSRWQVLVVHISFVRMDKFKFLAEFLTHQVLSSLILFLCQFSAFTHYVIDCFIAIIIIIIICFYSFLSCSHQH